MSELSASPHHPPTREGEVIQIIPAKSLFAKVAVLASGTMLGQLVTFACLPLLLKLYSPEQFGRYSAFITLAVVLSLLFTGRYDQAYVLAPNEKKRDSVLALNIALISVGLMVSIILFSTLVWVAPNWPVIREIGALLLVAPILGALFSCAYVFTGMLNARERYRDLAVSGAVQPILGSSSVLFGLTPSTSVLHSAGLAWGRLLSSLGAVLYAAYLLREELKKFACSLMPFKHLRETAQAYRQFPKYSLPFSCLELLSKDSMVLVLTAFGQLAAAGFYGVARLTLFAPVNLITYAMSQVIYKSASTSAGAAQVQVTSMRMVKLVCLVAAPGLTWVAWWAGDLLGWLNPRWQAAGLAFAALCPLAFTALIAAWAARLFEVKLAQKKLFALQIGFDLIGLVGSVSCMALGYPPIAAIIFVVVCSVICHLLQITFAFHLHSYALPTLWRLFAIAAVIALSSSILILGLNHSLAKNWAMPISLILTLVASYLLWFGPNKPSFKAPHA